MSKQAKNSINMTEGPMAMNILRFALPFMLASIMNLMFNAADVIVVGKFAGDHAQAAVTSTTSLVNLLINLFAGLGVGVNVVVAQAIGGGEKSRVGVIVHTSITMGLVAGTFLTVVGELIAPTLLRLMDSPDSIIGLSTLYLRFYFLGLPGALAYNFGSALLRARGDTKRPMYYLTLAGVVNVVLNLIFVVLFHWDVVGVAVATAISKWVSALLVMRCLMHESGMMHLELRELGINWAALKQIARIGLPAGLQSSLFSLSNVTIQSAVNSLGEVLMAGSGAAQNIGGFVYTTANAFYQSSLTFTGQNRGAGKPERIDRAFRWNLLFAFVFATATGLAAVAVGPWLLSIYTNNPEVIVQGMIRMRIVTICYGLCGIMEVCIGVMRGLGRSMLSMVVSLVATCAFRIAWVATVFAAVGTAESLFVCFPVSWVVAIVAFGLCILIIRPGEYAKICLQAKKTEQ